MNESPPTIPTGYPLTNPDRSPDQVDSGLPQVSTAISPPKSSGSVEASRVTLWLRRADQLLLGSLLIALITLSLVFRWKLSGGGLAEIEITSQQPREYFYSIDVNRASWVEWAQLDGIGEKLARRIVLDRSERGPFRSIDDVSRVRGLGRKLIDKLKPFLKCDDDPIKEPR